MTGDFTSVPLRASDRWMSARMQEGRVLLDTDWNLNIDGPARDTRELVSDTIGPCGVPAGSSAFQVHFVGNDLVISAGNIWIGGMLARNPADLHYTAQPQIDPLKSDGLALIYLDAFLEEVQAAEDPADLLDPALDGVDTTTRQRVGWRVRAARTSSHTCTTKGLPAGNGTGLLDVAQTAPPVASDPCAPPDDPRAKLPDGLLRIEVIDGGNEQTARFAWSYSDGGDAVAARVAGTAVTLVPSPSIAFAPGDLVEVSTLARREDRQNHGPLFSVADVTPQAGGALVTLGAPSSLTGNPPGTCLRRWDGQSVGAAGGVSATFAGADVGISFTAHAGSYLVGDWWGVRVRGSASDAVQTLTAAPPDGVVHAIAPLAVVDLGKHAVLTDCRPTFPTLTSIRGGTCTVTAFPGDDLQAAINKLPAAGGELCLAAGTYDLPATLWLRRKTRVVVTGVGPATILRIQKKEIALGVEGCDDFEIKDLRIEGGQPHTPEPGLAPGDKHLFGALTVLGSAGVRVHDCEFSCPDSAGRAQSCIYVAPSPKQGTPPDDVEIVRNRLEVGSQQTGILVISSAETEVRENFVTLSAPPQGLPSKIPAWVADEFARYIASHVVDDKTPDATAVPLQNGKTITVGGHPLLTDLITELVSKATDAQIGTAGSPRAALLKVARQAVLAPEKSGLDRTRLRLINESLTLTRWVGQGIVVAGSDARRVRIIGNEVQQVLQGIHVGVGASDEPQYSGQVVINGNFVDCLVPFYWSRQRHAIYVGSSFSTTLIDNHADLTRGQSAKSYVADLPVTPVEAVRIWGSLGQWLQVRGVDLTGVFAIGVHIVDTDPPPPRSFVPRRKTLRYVSDVLNADGAHGVVAPDYVTTERCIP
jgi:hypothetical protein